MSDDFHERATYVSRYAEHSSRLQNWIGGYGAGLASMLVYQFRTAVSDARDSIKTGTRIRVDSPEEVVQHIAAMHRELATSFTLIAAALGVQIFILFLNKATQFSVAHADEDESKWTRIDRLAEWCSRQFSIDAVCDLASVLLLAWATVAGIGALGLAA